MAKPQLEPACQSSSVHSSTCSTGKFLSQSGTAAALPSSDCPYGRCYLTFAARVNDSATLSTVAALLGYSSETPGDTATHKCRATCNFFVAVKTSGQVLVWRTQSTGKAARTVSETAGGGAPNEILPFSLTGLYLSNQTPPERSQRSVCDSKALNNLTAKCSTTPSLVLSYTDSIVFSPSKPQTEENVSPAAKSLLANKTMQPRVRAPQVCHSLETELPKYSHISPSERGLKDH